MSAHWILWIGGRAVIAANAVGLSNVSLVVVCAANCAVVIGGYMYGYQQAAQSAGKGVE